jgi:hypothetical protein
MLVCWTVATTLAYVRAGLTVAFTSRSYKHVFIAKLVGSTV